MNYKAKLAVVRRLQPAVKTVVDRYYADDVGSVRHTPYLIYRVFKRNIKQQGERVRRAELRRFAKIAFLIYYQPELSRRQVELIFSAMLAHSLILELIFHVFMVPVSATKKALRRALALLMETAKVAFATFFALFQQRIFIAFSCLLL